MLPVAKGARHYLMHSYSLYPCIYDIYITVQLLPTQHLFSEVNVITQESFLQVFSRNFKANVSVFEEDIERNVT